MFSGAWRVQAWDARSFHLMTHAFFSAAVPASGSVIWPAIARTEHLLHGGLRKRFHWCMPASSAGRMLPAPPLAIAGFFSVRMRSSPARWRTAISIRWWRVWSARVHDLAVIIFRMIFIVFHGKEQKLCSCRGRGHPTSAAISVLDDSAHLLLALIAPPLQGAAADN